MGKYRVTGPDGKAYMVTAPDGATREQIIARVQAHAAPKRDDSAVNALVLGIKKPFENAARYLSPVTKAVDAVGEKLGFPSSEQASSGNQRLRANNTRTGWQTVGNIVGTLPLARLPGGSFTQGAASGALLTDKRDARGIAQDTLIGGVAGKIGDKAVRGMARVVNPKVAPVVQRLKERGVSMTPGQILGATDSRVGGVLKGAEDRLTGMPIVGEVVTNARRRSVDTFNRAALNEPLKSIGKTLPKDVGTGNEGVAFVERSLGKAYDDVLPKLNVTGDSQFVSDLSRISANAKTMAPQRAQQFNAILNDMGRFWQQGSKMSGKDLKAVESRLGERIRNYGSSADPDARDLANSLRDIQSSLRDLAARQNPQYASRLKAINQGWANFTRVQRAAASASGKEGVFTPGQLVTSARVMDKTGRKAATARGDALMQRFAQDAQTVLPSSVPDSGTAGRLLFGLGGLGYIEPTSAITSGVAMLPYTAPGQKAAEWLLTGRQGPVASSLADLIRLASPVGASGATALSVNQP